MNFTSRQSASLVLGVAILLTGAPLITGSNSDRVLDRRFLKANAAGQEVRGGGRDVVAGLGVVEPAFGTINLSPMMPGVILTVTKAEGEAVKQGEILAELVNDDLKARLAQAETNVRIEEARLAQVENGPRAEEIEQAVAKVREEQGNLDLSTIQLRRHRVLAEQGAIARATFNETERAVTTSRQRLAAANKQVEILQGGSRPEEIDAARASYKLATEKLAEARAMLNKSYVRSTVDGIVLRRYLEPGEAVSTEPAAIIMQVADTSRLAIRTQIDENDIRGLKVGQKAEITAPFLHEKPVVGRVTHISPRLGAKTITAEAPDEKRDTRVLDVIVALDEGVSMPINLRVDVVIDLGSGMEPTSLRGSLDAPSTPNAPGGGCPAAACVTTATAPEVVTTGAIAP